MLFSLCTAVLAIPAQDRYIQACTLYLAYIPVYRPVHRVCAYTVYSLYTRIGRIPLIQATYRYMHRPVYRLNTGDLGLYTAGRANIGYIQACSPYTANPGI